MNPYDSDALSPHQSGQLQAFARYLAAMERGDADMLAAILREAAANPALERLILALHGVYDTVDATTPSAGEVAQAQAMLAALAMAASNDMQGADAPTDSTAPGSPFIDPIDQDHPAALNGASASAAPSPHSHPIPLRRTSWRQPRGVANEIRNEAHMDTRNTPDGAPASATDSAARIAVGDSTPTITPPTVAPTTRRRPARWLRVTQGLVAALVVAALVGSFFVVLQRLRPGSSTGPLGTITYEGPFNGKHVVVVGSWVGEVWALDPTTGNPYWRFNMGDGNPVTAVIVEGKYVVVGDTYLDKVRVFVLRLSDGQRVWTQARGIDGFPNTVYADQNAVYLCDTSGTYALRLSDGQQLWHIPDSQTEGVANGIVYLGTGLSNPPFGLLAIRSSDGQRLWLRAFGDSFFPQLVRVVGQTVYIGSAEYGLLPNGALLALNATSGATIRSLPPLPTGSQLVQVTDTRLFDLLATPTSERVCAYQFPSIVQSWCVSERYYPVSRASAALNDALYIQYTTQSNAGGANTSGISAPPPPSRPSIVAFDGATGKTQWKWVGPTVPDIIGTSPTGVSLGGAYDLQTTVGAPGGVYIGTSGGVFAVNSATGKLLWQFEPTAGDTFLTLTAV